MVNRNYALVIKRYVWGSLSCLYLIAGGFLRKKHRPLMRDICAHFGYAKEDAPNPLVPLVAVEELLGPSTTVTLAELPCADGNISTLELVIISALVRKTNPRHAFEIGTFDGRTTLNIALNQQFGSEVVTLDLPAGDIGSVNKQLEEADKKYIQKLKSGSRFHEKKTAARIIQVYGDSAKFDFREYKGRIDLMFIDGSHSYDYVLNDSIAALSLIRPGGIIIWHDYNSYWPGVTQALNELRANNAEFGNLRHISGTSLCILRSDPHPSTGSNSDSAI